MMPASRLLSFYLLVAYCLVTIGDALTTLDPNQINAEANSLFIQQLENTPDDTPVIFRLDLLTDDLVDTANTSITEQEDRVNYVVNGLSITNIWTDVLANPNGLTQFTQTLLGVLPSNVEPHPGFLESRQEVLQLEQVQGRNFTQEVLGYYQDVISTYNNSMNLPFMKAPLYILTYGYQDATNAKTFGIISNNESPLSGRCFIFINLGAQRMLQGDTFASAVIHETWHCFQSLVSSSPPNLLQSSLLEGAVTFLTSTVKPSISDPDLLFWSTEELKAAESRKEDILLAYQAARSETSGAVIREWIQLDAPLSAVPGAPSRCGYYIALLIVRAYSSGPSELPSDASAAFLLDTSESAEERDELWQALATQEGLFEDMSSDAAFLGNFLRMSSVIGLLAHLMAYTI